MHRLLPLALLLLPVTALADVPPPGGGCRCDVVSDPNLAWIALAMGLVVMVSRRR